MSPQEDETLPDATYVDIRMRFTGKTVQWVEGQVPRSVDVV
jgi:hypothetical protein